MVAPTENPYIRIIALHRDDWEKYTKMINKLVQQLSPGSPKVSSDDFFDAVGQENFTVYIVKDFQKNPGGEFIGMATVFFRHMLTGWIGEIHDVVVDERYYRQGFGRLLTQQIFGYAQHKARQLGKPIKLCLTSKPHREAANAMYVKYGFELIAQAVVERDPETGEEIVKGTNLYRKTIYH